MHTSPAPIRRLVRGRWTIPAIAGLLIVAAWTAGAFGAATTSAALMAAAAVVAGAPVAIAAVRALRARTIGIDLLVAVAAIGAIVLGEVWEAAAVTFLFAIGHALQAATLTRTRSALAELMRTAPDTAIVLRDGRQLQVPAAEVALGETVLIAQGAKVPVDGVVDAGIGAVDEAHITGESVPSEKTPGDAVFAGTISVGGMLHVRTTGVGADTTLARIIHRVEQAQDAKARTQAFFDRFAAWYTPAIMLLALAVGLLTSDVELALTLLVIGCPGALVISIPVAIVAGIGRGAREGILIKGGEHLEQAAHVDVVALDKTGTLTEGRPELVDVVVLADGYDREAVLALAARAEAGSGHPLARAIVDAQPHALDAGAAVEVETRPGVGIVATVDGRRVAVGTRELITQETDAAAAACPNRRPALADCLRLRDRAVAEAHWQATAGRTPMIVAVDGCPIAVLAVADRVRPEAVELVRRLREAGIRRVLMLTGDVVQVAGAVAVQVGIDEVHAGLLPEQKLRVIEDLRAAGHTVAMVGDGVNDAPALAAAAVGVAMGAAGSGLAIETADIALMADELLRLPRALELARRTNRTIRQNVAIAMITVAALLAGVMFGGVTMAIGMLVHELSVLAVIANAMRLLRAPRSEQGQAAASGTPRREAQLVP